MKQFILVLCMILALLCSSCTNKDVPVIEHMTSSGNIQNGGYVIKFDNCYIYANADDNNNLYKSSMHISDGEKIAGGHYFYEMNLYNNEIYYVASSPGEVWKISIDGSPKKRLIEQKVGNLIIYDEHIYYRLSEDNDWGKLYSADLNGRNRKLLKEQVKKFCIYDGLIYYFDIKTNELCSMNIDGTKNTVINDSYVNNIFVQNDMLIYSDHNRQDKLYAYDLKNNIEKCISEDMCWDINGNDDWIFYRNQSDAGSLYCVNFDGKLKHKLIEKNISDILIVEDTVFYRNIDENNAIEYFSITSMIK